MPTPDDFRASYKGTHKERYNKAIRKECPGGNGTLDLLNLIHQIRSRGRIENPLQLLETLEDKVQDIRDDMVTAIKGKYQIPPGPTQ